MINIYYCTDNKLYKQLVISLISLVSTTQEPLNVLNLTCENREYNPNGRCTTKQQDALCTKILKEKNPASTFRSIDVSDLFAEYLLKGPNTQNRHYKFSAYVSYRLVAHMLPGFPDKILYVDSDVLFPKDVKRIYDIDVSDFEYAGRRDKFRITKYIQSGVMLLNMKKIKEHNCFDKALKLIQTKKYIAYIDMSSLNSVCKHKKVISKRDICYNYRKSATIQHVCDLRESRIPFIKKWRHRIKIDKLPLARQRLPMYSDVYDKFDKVLNENPQLF